MNTKIIAMAAILATVAMLAGLVASTTTLTSAYADKSETEINQKCKQGGQVISGESNGAQSVSCLVGPGF